jgi:hypothetical protein
MPGTFRENLILTLIAGAAVVVAAIVGALLQRQGGGAVSPPVEATTRSAPQDAGGSGPSPASSVVVERDPASGPTLAETSRVAVHRPAVAAAAVTIRPGSPIFVEAANATVSVVFGEVATVPFATLTISPRNGEMVRKPLMGPDTVDFVAGGRKRQVRVLEVDWSGQAVRVDPG